MSQGIIMSDKINYSNLPISKLSLKFKFKDSVKFHEITQISNYVNLKIRSKMKNRF